MNRITRQDIDAQLEVYIRNLKALGIDHENIGFIEGSKKYGNSFKLVHIDPETGGHRSAPCTANGFLGWTRREAFERLCTINVTLFDVSYHLGA